MIENYTNFVNYTALPPKKESLCIVCKNIVSLIIVNIIIELKRGKRSFLTLPFIYHIIFVTFDSLNTLRNVS